MAEKGRGGCGEEGDRMGRREDGLYVRGGRVG
jgi:hypothetical protein